MTRDYIPTYFDISVRNSLQPSYMVQAAARTGIEAGELEKDIRHNSLVSASSVLHPLVVGLWTAPGA